MTQQTNNQVFAYAKQFTDNAFKAQAAMLKGMEQLATLQLGALEQQTRTATEFFTVASEARDADSFRGVWEKGVALSREGAEQAASLTRDVVALNQKVAESLVALAQDQQAANEAVAPAAAKKAAAK